MNIIVTGASRGIGYETVKALAQNPTNRIIAISRNKKAMEKLKGECTSGGVDNVIILEADLEKENIKEKLLPQVKEHFEYVDALINNAGAIVNKPIEQISDADIQMVYNVNVFGTFKLIRDLIPLFKAAKQRAHIVNISSMGGVQGSAKFPGLSVYSSSKGAVSILTECLAEELKEFNISVNCLALGAVQTEMLSEAFPGYKAQIAASQMAEYIAYFTLNGSTYFNGKILPVSISTP